MSPSSILVWGRLGDNRRPGGCERLRGPLDSTHRHQKRTGGSDFTAGSLCLGLALASESVTSGSGLTTLTTRWFLYEQIKNEMVDDAFVCCQGLPSPTRRFRHRRVRVMRASRTNPSWSPPVLWDWAGRTRRGFGWSPPVLGMRCKGLRAENPRSARHDSVG
jgi:hypothetical protein